MLLVDSTVWIDYFNGRRTAHTDYLDRILTSEIILVGDLILAEVLQGFRSQAEFELAKQALLRFTQVGLVSATLTVKSAHNFRSLRQLGVTPRKTIDCLMATACIENGYSLLHTDSDFDGFEQHLGLSVTRP